MLDQIIIRLKRWLKKSDYYDYNLLAVIILLTGFGLVMLYSTSAYSAQIKFNDDMYYFSKQMVISIVCILIAVFVSTFDYHILMRIYGLIWLLAIGLMMMVRSPFGVAINGAKRWLRFGPVQFQPAEVAKIAVIVAVPAIIITMGKRFRYKRGLIRPFLCGSILAAVAYVCTDNLSTAIIIFGIMITILFVAFRDMKPFIFGLLLLGGVAFVVIWAVSQGVGAGNFRLERIQVWLAPEKYAEEGGYQILQALYALGSGGIFGRGLGNSTQKLGSVPEAQNDMIFSIICEELGIFGGVIVMILFGYMLYRLFFIAQNAPDLYGSLIVTGVFAHIALQVVLNIAVVINLIPTTGITLPFISYGGTSILFLMMEMSIALSVSRKIRFRHVERDLWGDVVKKGY